VNKNLYDKEIEFPSDKQKHMKICFQKVPNADTNTEGYKRNLELQNKNFISYKQLKRIKNFFDNELRRMREYIKNTKTNKMDAGMMNQFIDSHEKKNFTNVRPSQEHTRTVDKYNAAVTESLKRINEIMLKL